MARIKMVPESEADIRYVWHRAARGLRTKRHTRCDHQFARVEQPELDSVGRSSASVSCHGGIHDAKNACRIRGWPGVAARGAGVCRGKRRTRLERQPNGPVLAE